MNKLQTRNMVRRLHCCARTLERHPAPLRVMREPVWNRNPCCCRWHLHSTQKKGDSEVSRLYRVKSPLQALLRATSTVEFEATGGHPCAGRGQQDAQHASTGEHGYEHAAGISPRPSWHAL